MKHLNNRLPRDLSTSVVNGYCVKNPTFRQIEDILKKYVYVYKDYNERFAFFIIICEWKFGF